MRAQDEPLNNFLQLGECPELEVYCTESIPEGTSFKAVTRSGEIIGVSLNGLVLKPVSLVILLSSPEFIFLLFKASRI